MLRHGLGGLIDRGRQFLQRTMQAASVPFETPALRFARVREDERHHLVALLRDFADNGSVLVVPWDALPKVVAMSARDAALHTAIAEAKAVTPDAIRSVMTSLAASGALGAEAKARQAAKALPEAAYHLHALASDVSSVIDVSRTVLHAIDGALEDIRATIRGGEAEFLLIRRAIDRLSWTLDGWPAIVDTGREILAGPAGEAVDRLLLLRRLLP